MITRSSTAFEDFLGSSIAPQVMPPWTYVILFQIKFCIWPGRTETTQQTRRSKWPGLSPIVEPGDLETANRKGE